MENKLLGEGEEIIKKVKGGYCGRPAERLVEALVEGGCSQM